MRPSRAAALIPFYDILATMTHVEAAT